MTDYLPEDHIAYRLQLAKETSTHDGVRRKFGQPFVKTGKLERSLAKHYTDLFTKRNKGDYNDFFDHYCCPTITENKY